jgi:Zn-dependent protease with chaperone function
MAESTARSAPAAYFDGVTSARHLVTATCAPSGIAISDRGGNPIAVWPYERLTHRNAPDHLLRLGLRDSDRLERLEIDDNDLAQAIDLACPDIDRTDAAGRAERRGAVGWSLAAIASLLLVAFYGLPQIADQLARAMPYQIEQHLGRAGDLRFRAAFDLGPAGRPFECGDGPDEIAGKAAFDKLIGKIAKGAGLATPIRATVVRRDEPNAFALAGGHVYVLKGLLDTAKDVDEVSAIIAHELGHVAHRDGTRSILQSAGISLIFGMMLGDFVGGAAVVVAAQSLFKARYSRAQEAAADDFAVRTLQELNANPRALAVFLERVATRPHDGGMSIFLGHPSVPERLARINAMAPADKAGAPLLDPSEWQALKRICANHN